MDRKQANSQDEADLVPLKAVVALLWLVAVLLVFVALDYSSGDDRDGVAASDRSLASAGAR
jgi:hypothetical protein